MCILIYDIDGTLTYAYGDIKDSTGFKTYAFWPLISDHFAADKCALELSIAKWECSMKTETDPTASSHKMMQRSLHEFISGVDANAVREYAKSITLKFIECGVIREEAIGHLEHNLEQGDTCILSTGSYQDGAQGFIDGLVEAGLLSSSVAQKILVSGAIVDWRTKTLIHANVRERKLVGLEKSFGKSINELKSNVVAVFADDPLINDRDILMLAPKGGAFVISTNKNLYTKIPDSYKHVTWQDIIGDKFFNCPN